MLSSLYNFLYRTIQDEDVMYLITGLMIIIAFLIFVAQLKAYLKNNEEVILNMKDTKEGKSERNKYLVKKYMISLFYWIVFSPIFKIGLLSEGTNVFIAEIIQFAAMGLVLDLILAVSEYINLERKVKKLNKD